ncbi:hypothetical protein SAMN04487785_108186 [Dyella jiangningensis]|uniref:DUF421 domain-containing protein n=1 Tax=Dyella sp. AtDHG13 TaxID=1938897 RepID=UPI00088345DB|nr:YetF domain-containing protein [Dyella sp. AtDHG13]PXV55815.1 hypothetical protein BDW41_11012 [Dyella sp. AtDHG13]SDK55645.1 hypothetical protein SAMN04487785_108186 [Dyella jiangningensis]
MFTSWFATQDPWWTYAVRGALTYLGLLVLMRLAGKRSFGELSSFDIVVLALAGGTLRTAVIGHDTSMSSGFIGVASMLAVDKGLGWLCARHERFNRWIEGYPSIIAREGRRLPDALRRANLPEAAFNRALHAAGHETEHKVVVGRLEPNGKITLVFEPVDPPPKE